MQILLESKRIIFKISCLVVLWECILLSWMYFFNVHSHLIPPLHWVFVFQECYVDVDATELNEALLLIKITCKEFFVFFFFIFKNVLVLGSLFPVTCFGHNALGSQGLDCFCSSSCFLHICVHRSFFGYNEAKGKMKILRMKFKFT